MLVYGFQLERHQVGRGLGEDWLPCYESDNSADDIRQMVMAGRRWAQIRIVISGPILQ